MKILITGGAGYVGSNNFGTNLEPTYPAPPVIKILFIFFYLLCYLQLITTKFDVHFLHNYRL